MDVHCSTCGEPWDVHHFWHDAIFETDLTPEEATAWQALPPGQKLNERYRNKFQAAVGNLATASSTSFVAPAVPQTRSPIPEQVALKAALEDLLGDDEDALAATFEDHHL